MVVTAGLRVIQTLELLVATRNMQYSSCTLGYYCREQLPNITAHLDLPLYENSSSEMYRAAVIHETALEACARAIIVVFTVAEEGSEKEACVMIEGMAPLPPDVN